MDDGEGEGWDKRGGGEEVGFIMDEAEEKKLYQARKRQRMRRRQAVSSSSSSSDDDDDAGVNNRSDRESECWKLSFLATYMYYYVIHVQGLICT